MVVIFEKENMDMKRYIGYLFAFTAIALLFAGCEKPLPSPPSPPEEEHEITFAAMEITPSQREALVQTKPPVYTIDGETVSNFQWGLEYASKSSSEWNRVSDVENSGDTYIYIVGSLEPQTEYKVRQWAKNSLGNVVYGDEQGFVTKKEEDTPGDYQLEVSVGKITPFGLYAQIELKSVRYLINGSSSPIDELSLEYSLASEIDFQSVAVSGWDYQSSYVVEIPSSEEDYLIENSDYVFRLVVTPGDASAQVLKSKDYTFTTVEAVVDAQIPSPQVNYTEEGLWVEGSGISIVKDNRLVVTTSNISVEYAKQGSNSWNEVYATIGSQGYSALIPAEELLPETTYKIRTKVITPDASYNSSEVLYTTPEEGDPGQPPVTPPEGGDTSMMEGVWKLTQWRGIQPDFEVYMEIDATGGVLLWQRIDSRNWEQYLSAAYTEDGVISGVYDDGVAWGASYYYSVNGDSMTWTDTQDSSDVSVYQRSTLPEDLRKIQRSSQQTTALSRFL